MGTYSKVVSTVKPLNNIRTFIGGVAKDITSAWTFVNGVRKQVFPTTEVWTEIYSNSTPGSYSQSLSWGKYKVVISGAGGGGGMFAKVTSATATAVTVKDGYKGATSEIIINVNDGGSKTVSGIIGAAGGAGHVNIKSTLGLTVVDAGTGGAGYASGTSGDVYKAYDYANRIVTGVGGAGGGSTSTVVDGVTHVAKGGNGGYAQYVVDSSLVYIDGGKGGSGGTSAGTGAAGGNRIYIISASENVDYYSNTGSNGYVKIYKSNIYPN